jgi:hypothetical protein
LEFFYLNLLKIVTVKTEIRTTKEISGGGENSLLSSENVFNYLYDKDDGLESPNLANKILLNNMG